jgi:hypothetical protein
MATIDPRILARLTTLYDRRLLVPFTGAGISAPNSALWEEFIQHLEVEARIQPGFGTAPSQLIQRAARAVRQLPRHDYQQFTGSIRQALVSKELAPIPPGAQALARIWWPLVITTNYDDWFLCEWNSIFATQKQRDLERMLVCGRTPVDCERVLNSLRAPDNPLLWAIQGFIGGQHLLASKPKDVSGIKRQQLAEEIVIGHAEYRREAYRSVGFRRAFSEVFRSRSLFFVGSGLTEDYFANLFDEVLELQGTLSHMHYALIQAGRLDVDFLKERFQIHAIEYTDHKDVPKWIDAFREGLLTRQIHSNIWGIRSAEPTQGGYAEPGLQVVSSRTLLLPANPNRGDECLLISAGKNDEDLAISGSGRSAAKAHFPHLDEEPVDRRSEYVWKFRNSPVYVARARDESRTGRKARDARIVFDAFREALDCARQDQFTGMQTTLLAAGQYRVFSPYVSLIQMVRAYAAWSRQQEPGFHLTISVGRDNPGKTSSRVPHLLTSGRLSLIDLVEVEELRFWVEIWRSPSDVSRFLEIADERSTLRSIMQRYGISNGEWSAVVVPSPVQEAEAIPARQVFEDGPEDWTVVGAGIIPGSTLQIIPDRYLDPNATSSQT